MKERASPVIIVLLVCSALITGCSTPDRWQAKVIYSGEWQGALYYNNNFNSISGTGEKTLEIPIPGDYISIDAQKMDNSSAILTVQILRNGNIVATDETDSQHGVGMTSVSVK